MKRKKAGLNQIFCTAIALLFLCGCAQSSKDAAMSPIQLDTAQMMQTAASEAPKISADTLRERLNAPETVQYVEKNGVVTLAIDARVLIPSAGAVPIVRTSGVDFTQEQVDTILALLWQNDSMWDNNPPLTKAQIAEEIASIEFNLETLADYQDEREYYETIRIPELREMLKTAPDTADPARSDGQLSIEQILDGATDKVVARVTQLSIHGDSGRYFYVRNNPDNQVVLENTRIGRLNVRKWAKLGYQAFSDGARYDSAMTAFSGTKVDPGDQMNPAAGNGDQSQSPAQAAEIAEDFFSSLGEDVSIFDMYLFEDDSQSAYLIRCVRNVQGIPCILMDGESNMLYTQSADEEVPDAVWVNETITLVISESGILQFDWDSPHQLGETLVEDCALLPFSEIMKVCTSMLPLLFDEEWGHIEDMTRATISIDRIEFGMMRIIKNQSIDEGFMVPVWAFYGSDPFESASLGSQNQAAKKSKRLLVINAIDGTVVEQS